MKWTQGRAIHKMLFPTVMFTAGLVNYNRAFGKYTIPTKVSRRMARPTKGFVWGPYYTRTVLLDGILFKHLDTLDKEKILGLKQGDLNLNADNGLAAKTNGEDEIVTATLSDSWEQVRWARANLKNLRAYKTAQETDSPKGELWKKVHLKGMPWSDKALDNLSFEFFEKLASIEPPFQGMSTALLARADGKALIGDDRDMHFLSEIQKMDKWLRANDLPTTWLRFIGKSFARTRAARYLDDKPIKGIFNNPMWRSTLVFMLYAALVPGVYGISAVGAAQALGLIILTMVFVPSLFGAVLNYLQNIGGPFSGVKGYGGEVTRPGMLKKIFELVKDLFRWTDEKGSTTYLTSVLDVMDIVEATEDFWGFHHQLASPPARPASLSSESKPLGEFSRPNTTRRGLLLGFIPVFLLVGKALLPYMGASWAWMSFGGFVAAAFIVYVAFIRPALRSDEYKHRLSQYLEKDWLKDPKHHFSQIRGLKSEKDIKPFIASKHASSFTLFLKLWLDAYGKTKKGPLIGGAIILTFIVGVVFGVPFLTAGALYAALAGCLFWLWNEYHRGSKVRKPYEAVAFRRIGSHLLLVSGILIAVGLLLPILSHERVVPYYYLPLTMPLWFGFLSKSVGDSWDGNIFEEKGDLTGTVQADRMSMTRGILAAFSTVAMIYAHSLQQFFGLFNKQFDPNTFFVAAGTGTGGMSMDGGGQAFGLALQGAHPVFMGWATFIIASTFIRLMGGLLWWIGSFGKWYQISATVVTMGLLFACINFFPVFWPIFAMIVLVSFFPWFSNNGVYYSVRAWLNEKRAGKEAARALAQRAASAGPEAAPAGRSEKRALTPEDRATLDVNQQALLEDHLAQRAVYDGTTGTWTPVTEADLLNNVDWVLVLGSSDDQVPLYAAEIVKTLRGANLDLPVITSGMWGMSADTAGVYTDPETRQRIPEATYYANVMAEHGAPVTATEITSRNTGSNFRDSVKVMRAATNFPKGFSPKRVLVIQTPWLQARAGAVAVVELPKALGIAPQDMRIFSYAPYLPNVAALSDETAVEKGKLALSEVNKIDTWPDHKDANGQLDPWSAPLPRSEVAKQSIATLEQMPQLARVLDNSGNEVALDSFQHGFENAWSGNAYVRDNQANIPKRLFRGKFLLAIDPAAQGKPNTDGLKPNRPTDLTRFYFKKIQKFLNERGILFHPLAFGRKYFMVAPKELTVPYHTLMISDDETVRPNILTAADVDTSLTLAEQNPGMKFLQNTEWYTAEQLHIHVTTFGLPFESLASSAQTIGRDGNVALSQVKEWPLSHVIFRGVNKKELTASSMKLIKVLQDEQIPHWTMISKGQVVVFMGRPNTPVAEVGAILGENHTVHVLEAAGVVTVTADKKDLTEAQIEAGLKAASLDAKEVDSYLVKAGLGLRTEVKSDFYNRVTTSEAIEVRRRSIQRLFDEQKSAILKFLPKDDQVEAQLSAVSLAIDSRPLEAFAMIQAVVTKLSAEPRDPKKLAVSESLRALESPLNDLAGLLASKDKFVSPDLRAEKRDDVRPSSEGQAYEWLFLRDSQDPLARKKRLAARIMLGHALGLDIQNMLRWDNDADRVIEALITEKNNARKYRLLDIVNSAEAENPLVEPELHAAATYVLKMFYMAEKNFYVAKNHPKFIEALRATEGLVVVLPNVRVDGKERSLGTVNVHEVLSGIVPFAVGKEGKAPDWIYQMRENAIYIPQSDIKEKPQSWVTAYFIEQAIELFARQRAEKEYGGWNEDLEKKVRDVARDKSFPARLDAIQRMKDFLPPDFSVEKYAAMSPNGTKGPSDVKRSDDEKAADALNARSVEAMLPDLRMPTILFYEDETRGIDVSKAVEAVRSGRVIHYVFAAGAASRLSESLVKWGIITPEMAKDPQYRMWRFNGWSIVQRLRDKLPELEAKRQVFLKEVAPESALTEAQKKAKQTELGELDHLIGVAREGVPEGSLDWGLGKRHIWTIVEGLRAAAQKYGFDFSEALSHQKIIISFNRQILEDIGKTFVENNFFGLNPDNVKLVYNPDEPPAFAWNPETRDFVYTDRGANYNHAFNLINADIPYMTYSFDPVRRQFVSVAEPVIQTWEDQSADDLLGIVHRINDMILMRPESVVDIPMLALFEKLASENNAMVLYEVLNNMTEPRQKGGLALGHKDLPAPFSMLVEGLATYTPAVQAALKTLSLQAQAELNLPDLPFNRMHQIVSFRPVYRWLREHNQMLTMALKAHKPTPGFWTLELPEGNVTIPPSDEAIKAGDFIRSVAMMRRRDVFHEDGILPIRGTYNPEVSPQARIADIKDASGLSSLASVLRYSDRRIRNSGFLRAEKRASDWDLRNDLYSPSVEKRQTARAVISREAGVDILGLLSNAELSTLAQQYQAADPVRRDMIQAVLDSIRVEDDEALAESLRVAVYRATEEIDRVMGGRYHSRSIVRLRHTKTDDAMRMMEGFTWPLSEFGGPEGKAFDPYGEWVRQVLKVRVVSDPRVMPHLGYQAAQNTLYLRADELAKSLTELTLRIFERLVLIRLYQENKAALGEWTQAMERQALRKIAYRSFSLRWKQQAENELNRANFSGNVKDLSIVNSAWLKKLVPALRTAPFLWLEDEHPDLEPARQGLRTGSLVEFIFAAGEATRLWESLTDEAHKDQGRPAAVLTEKDLKNPETKNAYRMWNLDTWKLVQLLKERRSAMARVLADQKKVLGELAQKPEVKTFMRLAGELKALEGQIGDLPTAEQKAELERLAVEKKEVKDEGEEYQAVENLVKDLEGLIKQADDPRGLPKEAKHLGLGARHLLSLSEGLVSQSRALGLDPQEVLKHKIVMISVNENVAEDVERDLRVERELSFGRTRFFGFDPRNIVMVMNPDNAMPFKYVKEEGAGRLIFVPDRKNYGHACNISNARLPWFSLTWDEGAQRFTPSAMPANKYVEGRYQGKVSDLSFLVHRVNDLIPLRPESAVPVEMYALYLDRQKKHQTELLYWALNNFTTPRQKGGLGLGTSGSDPFSFLVEGMATEDWAVKARLRALSKEWESKPEAQRLPDNPYNRLFMIVNWEKAFNAVESLGGLVEPIAFSPHKKMPGVFMLDLASGNLTRHLKSEAMLTRKDAMLDVDPVLGKPIMDPNPNYEKFRSGLIWDFKTIAGVGDLRRVSGYQDWRFGERKERRVFEATGIVKVGSSVPFTPAFDLIPAGGRLELLVNDQLLKTVTLTAKSGKVLTGSLNGNFYDDQIGGTQTFMGETLPHSNPVDVSWETIEAQAGSRDVTKEHRVLYSNHNFMHNDWVVMYDGNKHQFYYSGGEPFGQRVYSMAVVWKDGRASSEDFRFLTDHSVKGGVRVYRAADKTEKHIGDEIAFATFGQRIMNDTVVDGKATVRHNVSLAEIAHQFSDGHQTYNSIQFMARKADGRPQYGTALGYTDILMSGKARPIVPEDRPEILKAAQNGGYFEMDLTPYLTGAGREALAADLEARSKNEKAGDPKSMAELARYAQMIRNGKVLEAIEEGAIANWLWGYHRIQPKPAGEMKTGEYFIAANKLYVKLTPARYPNDLIAVTAKGRAVMIVLPGEKYVSEADGGKGYSIEEMQNLIRQKNLEPEFKDDPIVAAHILANSKDAFKLEDGKPVAGQSSDPYYPSGTAAIMMTVPVTAEEKAQVEGQGLRKERRVPGSADIFEMKRHPAMIGNTELTAGWISMIQSGNVTSQQRDLSGREYRSGLRISSHGASIEHFATEVLTGKDHAGVFQEKVVGPYKVSFVWHRGIRPNATGPTAFAERKARFETHDKTKCSICSGQFSVRDRKPIAVVEVNGRKWVIVHNLSPVDAKGSFLLVPARWDAEDKLLLQRLTDSDIDDLTALVAQSQNLSIHFDGPLSGSSQPHIHAKIYSFGPEWDETRVTAVSDAEGRKITEGLDQSFTGLSVEEVRGPVKGMPEGENWKEEDVFVTRWSAADWTVVARALKLVIPQLYKREVPNSVVWQKKNGKVSAYLVLRETGGDISAEFPGETFGSSQLIDRVFPFESQKDFDAVTAKSLWASMTATTMPREQAIVLIQDILGTKGRAELRGVPSWDLVQHNIEKANARLERAIRTGEDVDLSMVITSPETVLKTRKLLEKQQPNLFSPSKIPLVIAAESGEGSLGHIDSILKGLRESLGAAGVSLTNEQVLERFKDKTVIVILTSGEGSRMKMLSAGHSLRNKGLTMTPSGAMTYLEQVERGRVLYNDSQVGPRLVILAVDSAVAPEFEVNYPIDEGFAFYGQTYNKNNPEVYKLGAAQVPEPRKPGVQPITRMIEKADPKNGLINEFEGEEVVASHGSYSLSWPAFLWLSQKKAALDRDFPGHPPINWVEGLFEAGTLGAASFDKYVKHYQQGPGTPEWNLGSYPEFVRALVKMAKEARDTFGFAAVNMGENTLYLHANKPIDLVKTVGELYENVSKRRLLGVGIVGWKSGGAAWDPWYYEKAVKSLGKVTADQIWSDARYQGRIIDVEQTRIEDGAELGPKAVVLGVSVIQKGSWIYGLVRSSSGIFTVPENASVVDVLSLDAPYEVEDGMISIAYVIQTERGLSQVIVTVAPGYDPKQIIRGIAIADDPSKRFGNDQVGWFTVGEILARISPEAANTAYDMFDKIHDLVRASNKSVPGIVSEIKNIMTRAGIQAERSEKRAEELPTVTLEQFTKSDFEGPVVIGGTGMIGSHFIETLVNQGQRVAVPLRSQGEETHIANLRRVYKQLEEKGIANRLVLVNMGAFMDPRQMDASGAGYQALEQLLGKATAIYHLAAQTSTRPEAIEKGSTVKESPEEFIIRTYVVNVFYTKLIARIAQKLGKPMVYSSSQAIFALEPLFKEPMNQPVTEETPIPFDPTTRDFMDRLNQGFDSYVSSFVDGKASMTPEQFTKDLLEKTTVARLNNPSIRENLFQITGDGMQAYRAAKAVEFDKAAQPQLDQALRDLEAKYPLILVFGNYAISKLLPEKDVLGLQQGNGLVFRFVNLFGKGMHPNNVLQNYLEDLMKLIQGKISIMGLHTTSALREFMAAMELAGPLGPLGMALAKLIRRQFSKNQIIHVGPGRVDSMEDALVATGDMIEFDLRPLKDRIPRHLDQPYTKPPVMDYGRLKKELPGAQPKMTVAAGMKAEFPEISGDEKILAAVAKVQKTLATGRAELRGTTTILSQATRKELVEGAAVKVDGYGLGRVASVTTDGKKPSVTVNFFRADGTISARRINLQPGARAVEVVTNRPVFLAAGEVGRLEEELNQSQTAQRLAEKIRAEHLAAVGKTIRTAPADAVTRIEHPRRRELIPLKVEAPRVQPVTVSSKVAVTTPLVPGSRDEEVARAVAAAASTSALRFETEILPGVVNAEALRLEIRLIRTVMEMLGIKSSARNFKGFGSHIIEYNPADGFDADYIAQRLDKTAAGSKFIVVVNSADRNAAEKALGRFVKAGHFELRFGNATALLQAAVNEEMDRLGIAADKTQTNRDVLQAVVADGIERKDLIAASALLNQFVDVVTVTGSRTRVSAAFPFEIGEILRAEIRAAQVVGKSA
ncbi:MAG TPA: NAD-dependent epimerase/dehydratase family protein [Candidatus Omnitrophota bacterium]|nr:NAD-dependent epimerase/dehydratase family protein [Candidatus Omnitrophota bacterium]